MADVKWIKIVTDIFDDEKVLLIESLPEADSIIVIWFKLLCLAGKNNNSGVFMLNDKIPYTDEMLATIFRRGISTIRLALRTFEEFGMVEIVNSVITIPNWSKHQTLDQLEERKKYMKSYMRDYREKQKQLASGNKVSENGLPLSDWVEAIDYFNNKCAYCGDSQSELEQEHIIPVAKGGLYEKANIIPSCRRCNSSKNDKDMVAWYKKQPYYDANKLKKINQYVNNVNSLRKVNVNSLEVEEELDIDIDKDKKKGNKKPLANAQTYFHDTDLNNVFLDFIKMRKSLKNGTMTDRAITMMVNKLSKYDIETAIKMLEQSILNNWKDVYEVKETDKPKKSNKFNNFEQRDYDYDNLEKKLQEKQKGMI